MAAPVKAIVLAAGLFACSNSESLTAQVMPTAKPVGAAVHVNTAAPELERYTRIVGNLADCSLEGHQVPATCPGMVRYSDSVRGIPNDLQVLVGREMLGNASPAIRVEAAKLVLAAGRTGDALDTVATAAVREQDANVLRAHLELISADGAKRPSVAKALLAAADHRDAGVRLAAIDALTAPHNRGVAGAVGKLRALAEHDREATVRRHACELAGALGSDDLIPLYEKLTEQTSDAELYAACMEGLVRMFHHHPKFDTANKQAYDLFLRRLERKPRTEHAPPWTVMSTFCYYSHESDLDRLAAWKQRATWFDAAAVKRVMSDVIADKTANWMARAAAVESMVGLGATKPELEALRRGYSASDTKDRPVFDKLASVLSE
jgi:hypothetical protein